MFFVFLYAKAYYIWGSSAFLRGLTAAISVWEGEKRSRCDIFLNLIIYFI